MVYPVLKRPVALVSEPPFLLFADVSILIKRKGDCLCSSALDIPHTMCRLRKDPSEQVTEPSRRPTVHTKNVFLLEPRHMVILVFFHMEVRTIFF